MLQVIKRLLLNIVDNIDSGNSNITEEETVKLVEALKSYTDKTQRLSKYQACQKLNVSRATFDNLVRLGIIPRGKKAAGFKEISWDENDLRQAIAIRNTR